MTCKNYGGKKRSMRSRGKHGKKHRGGQYSSAATYESAVVGTPNSQWNRTFSQTGPNQTSSNAIVGTQYTGSLGYKPYQQAGGKSKSRKAKGNKRTKKGGFWGSVINQAIVPFGLLGLQQRYGKRKTVRRH